ncbi:MAG: hypothetical protein Q4C23_02335 [Mycoplasmatota bacterium]|nr:hypothetical protein [Mycoplasmatota bacterium]
MGRELRRKQAKKEGKSLKREELDEGISISKLIKIICLLIFVVGILYLISALFITKELDWFNKDNNQNSEGTVSNSILAASIFKQSEDEYYVYFYDFKNEDSEISNNIKSKLSTAKIYKVDTSSAMNSKYIAEESNKNAKKLEDLKVKAPTVIKIKNNEIIAYYEGTEIKNNLS